MANPYLLLWLEAPLQAWGHDSKFGRRDSLDFPTKSGVLGLLCCARGARGLQTEWLAAWADLDMHTVAYVPRNAQGQPLPRLPLLRDFQMVGSGYDDQDPWQTQLIPKKSDGGKAVGGGKCRHFGCQKRRCCNARHCARSPYAFLEFTQQEFRGNCAGSLWPGPLQRQASRRQERRCLKPVP